MIKLFFAFCLLFIFNSLRIQAEEYDNSSWTSLELKLPITKDFDISINREIRTENDFKVIDWHITDFEISYDLSKKFDISTKYRYKYGPDKWQKNLYIDFGYNDKFGKIELDYRFRIQKKFRYEEKKNKINRKDDEDYIRNKFNFEYDTDEWIKPNVAFEIFYLINNFDYTDRFCVFRYYLALKMDTFKDQEIEIYYMYEREFNINDPQVTNVIGIDYSIDLPRLF